MHTSRCAGCVRHANRGDSLQNAASTTRDQSQEQDMDEKKSGKCPVIHTSSVTGEGRSNRDWWPNQLNLHLLHQHSALSNPLGAEFNYTEEFKKLDFQALK